MGTKPNEYQGIMCGGQIESATEQTRAGTRRIPRHPSDECWGEVVRAHFEVFGGRPTLPPQNISSASSRILLIPETKGNI